jgi:hypothetical protein
MKGIFPLRNIRFIFLMTIFVVLFQALKIDAALDEQAPGIKMAKQATKKKDLWITADHSKHSILQKDFKSGPEVTVACLSCHTEAALQFHKTIHWTWMDSSTEKGARLGKGGLSINNF